MLAHVQQGISDAQRNRNLTSAKEHERERHDFEPTMFMKIVFGSGGRMAW